MILSFWMTVFFEVFSGNWIGQDLKNEMQKLEEKKISAYLMSLCNSQEIFDCIRIVWILVRMHDLGKLPVSFLDLLNACILAYS